MLSGSRQTQPQPLSEENMLPFRALPRSLRLTLVVAALTPVGYLLAATYELCKVPPRPESLGLKTTYSRSTGYFDVSNIDPGSPASEAGLGKGDRIVDIGEPTVRV